MALRDYSSQRLAARIYLTHSTVSGYRNGTRMPDCEILCNIAKELQVSTDFLLCITDYICVSKPVILPQE
ncbi:MAG: helix-turn-helix domain-containing protein [Agathobacter sp.]